MSWWLVALGGALGAMARYGLSFICAPTPGQWPWATFIANVLGCFCVGVIYALLMAKPWPPEVRLVIQVGFLGALTTFSTFSLEAFNLFILGHIALAISYVLATLLSCLIAVWLGHSLLQLFN
jgi:fluoride exporter